MDWVKARKASTIILNQKTLCTWNVGGASAEGRHRVSRITQPCSDDSNLASILLPCLRLLSCGSGGFQLATIPALPPSWIFHEVIEISWPKAAFLTVSHVASGYWTLPSVWFRAADSGASQRLGRKLWIFSRSSDNPWIPSTSTCTGTLVHDQTASANLQHFLAVPGSQFRHICISCTANSFDLNTFKQEYWIIQCIKPGNNTIEIGSERVCSMTFFATVWCLGQPPLGQKWRCCWFPCGSFWNTTLLKIANSVHGIEFHGVNFSLFHVYIFNMSYLYMSYLYAFCVLGGLWRSVVMLLGCAKLESPYLPSLRLPISFPSRSKQQ